MPGQWNESEHPRDRSGRFIAADKLEAAKTDPAAADELRANVRPEDAAKLEKAIGGDHTPRTAKHFEDAVGGKDFAGWPSADGARPFEKYLDDQDAGLKRLYGEHTDTDAIRHAAIAHIRDTIRSHGGTTGKGKWNLKHLVDVAYDSHSRQVGQERSAAKFADDYFNDDSAGERAGKFIEALLPEDSKTPGLDPDLLPEDVREAIVDDLAHWSDEPEDLAHAYAQVLENWGADTADSNSALGIVGRALAAKAHPSPLPFKPDSGTGTYSVADLRGLTPSQREAVMPFVRAAGVVQAATEDGVYLVSDANNVSYYPMNQLGNEDGGSWHGNGEGDTGNEADAVPVLFHALKSPFTVGDAEVPASAKDTGTTSGGKEIEKDWDPDKVDVYRRLNRDWFVVRYGSASPKAVENSGRYAYVRRKDAPSQTRLPPQYWQGMKEADESDFDEDAAAKREKKEGGESAGERQDIDRHREQAREWVKDHRSLKDWHNRVSGQQNRAEAQAGTAEGIADQFDLDVTWTDEGPHNDALNDLDGALTELRSHVSELPDLPAWDLEPPQLRVMGRYDAKTKKYTNDVNPFDSREEEAGHLESENDRYEGERDNVEESLKESEDAHREHLDGLREKWQAAADAARKVVQTGAGGDDDARSNSRLAAKVLLTATKALRKLKPGPTKLARELSMAGAGWDNADWWRLPADEAAA